MRHISPSSIIGLGFLLIAGAYIWHFYSSKTPQPSAVISEEKPTTVEAVLQTMPTEPDFSLLAKDMLQSVVVHEVSILKPYMDYLSILEQTFVDSASALKSPTSVSCDVVKVMEERISHLGTPSLSSDNLSHETIQDERDAFDATATEKSSRYYEQWGNWGIQLDEVIPEDNKKQKKAVEKFQKKFGDITDDYENDLDEAVTALRKHVDSSMEVVRTMFQKEANFSSDLKTWLDSNSSQCTGGETQASLSHQILISQMGTWQIRTSRLTQSIVEGQTKMIHLPAVMLPSLEPKTKAETETLYEALTTMRDSLK